MRGQPLQFDLTLWQKRLNSQLGAFFGLRDDPADVHDMLADIRTRLGTQESLLQKLVQAVETPSLPTTSTTLPSPAPTAFEFRDIKKPPVVNGTIKPKLTQAQHDILMELLKAGPSGLSLEDLDDKSGHPEARKALKKLCKDADWQSVILFPGKKCQGGYRLRFS